MFYLHASNRTENLLRHLATVISIEGARQPFTKEMFLIQSQGMERMICQTLADQLTSFCNFQFMFPLSFLSYIAEKTGLQVTPDGYERQILAWRIESILRDISQQKFAGLSSYLTGNRPGRKRFQLARKLANIFDQYQLMRPEMLDGWARQQRSTSSMTEEWQMELWLRLTADHTAGKHRGVIFREVIERLGADEKIIQPLPPRISVFGLHIMSPIFLEFLNKLSEHCDVHLYILSPCKHYWGDIETKRVLLQRSLRLAAQGMSVEQEIEVDEKHPLLAGLGQQGRDFQKMMLENVDFGLEFESFVDPLQVDGAPTLLQRLQYDLLHGEVTTAKTQKYAQPDNSIQIVSCHSPYREISVLKDHLLRLLNRDHDLQLRDIIVMAPDIQEYAFLIPAVFDDIQFSIADYSLQRKNDYINAFLSFLELYKGRFGWSEVMDLLRQPVISSHFDLTAVDLDCLQQWVVGAGIRWGLSADQRQQVGVDFTEASWFAGLERLLMGYAVNTEEFVDDVLPFVDIEGSGAGILGDLCEFIDIIEGARLAFLEEHDLAGWSRLLLDIFERLFGVSDKRDYTELRNIISRLTVDYSPFHSDKLGFEVILEWFTVFVQESRSASGFLRGQLTFCSMLPMRSVPFKVVCLLGLNDGVFPKNDNKSTFDLMAEEFRPGDRSARADDRYQFLEALLAARSHLYLSYVGQSIRTNEAVPPSVVLTEFIELLDAYGLEKPVVSHPLHPFSREYFVRDGDPDLFSYNSYYCTTAKNLQKTKVAAEPWWQSSLEGETKEINFNDLLAFYRNPQTWFVTTCLGVSLDGGDELPQESESFESAGLIKYQVEQEIVRRSLAGEETEILAELKADGRWPLGRPGELGYQLKLDELSSFTEAVRSQDMGERIADEVFELRLGPYILNGSLANLYENGVMCARYAELKGKDLLLAWLHHLVANHLFAGRKSVLITSSKVYKFSAEASSPGLELLLAHFTAGCSRPSSFFVEPSLIYCRQLNSKRSKVSPLEKSREFMQRSLEHGYEPAWAMILQGMSVEDVLAAEFESFCFEIMNPIWSAANGS